AAGGVHGYLLHGRDAGRDNGAGREWWPARLGHLRSGDRFRHAEPGHHHHHPRACIARPAGHRAARARPGDAAGEAQEQVTRRYSYAVVEAAPTSSSTARTRAATTGTSGNTPDTASVVLRPFPVIHTTTSSRLVNRPA